MKVNPKGVNENDFVFILGYPGRTFRHRPSQFIAYQQHYLLPYTSNLYEFQNKAMEQVGKRDRDTELKLSTRIKRNANVMKNYRGKLKGLNGLDLVKQKQIEDEQLAQYINANAELRQQYGSLMGDIDKIYKLIYNDAHRDMWLSQIYSSTSLLTIARNVNAFKAAMLAKPVSERNDFYTANIGKLKQQVEVISEGFDLEADRILFTRMIEDANKLPKNQRILAIDKQILKGFNSNEAIGEFVARSLQYTKLKDQAFLSNTLFKSAKAMTDYNDLLLNFEKDLSAQILGLKPESDRREGLVNKLMGDYVAVKEKFLKKDFIPDANSTLRLTYGYVKGYSPADATYMKPFTSIKGIIEKGSTNDPEYSYPPVIKQLWKAKDFGPFAKADMNDVPVSFLYNMDTTGGNSGSPVINDKGELIGVNFDRAYEATINDYAWNDSYSRSIGVDIRYVLWVAAKIDKADFLINEMGVKL